jgi:hypothetical protein
MAELLVGLAITDFVEVINVDEGLTTTELHATFLLLDDDLTMTDVEEDFRIELVDTLLLVDELTAPTWVEVEAFTTTEDEDDFTTPALVELASTELELVFVDAFAVDVAIDELAVDFVNALVVEAGTEEEVVLTTAAFVDTDVPLTPPGDAGDQNMAGVYTGIGRVVP